MNEVFGPFRLISFIARGGMAETFVGERARPDGSTKRVCVKRIRSEASRDPLWIEMFQTEAAIAATLHHPNIAALHEFGETNGEWWMSLELVEGVTLRQLMTTRKEAGRSVPIDALLFIAAELAKALSHAHGQTGEAGVQASVVHRDVTPTNVLIRNDGAVKLVDFGIAKVMGELRTRTGKSAAKAGYMSPEQCEEIPADGRTDLFSLGVVLFEGIAGIRPFDGETEWMTRINTVRGVRRDLRALAPETPDAIVQIVESLIEIDRERRTASAEALLEALRAVPLRHGVQRSLGAYTQGARLAIERARDSSVRVT